MPREEKQTGGLAASLRWFPSEQKVIEDLILRDGEFRDMCDELAMAEEALRAAEHLPSAVREERIAEWTAVVQNRAFEIARALREANVVRVGWGIQKRRE